MFWGSENIVISCKENSIFSNADLLRVLVKNHAYENLWYHEISQIAPKLWLVDVTPTLVKLQIS